MVTSTGDTRKTKGDKPADNHSEYLMTNVYWFKTITDVERDRQTLPGQSHHLLNGHPVFWENSG